MSSRNLDLALAGSKGVKVLPDLPSTPAHLNDVVTVTTIDPDGAVRTGFSPLPAPAPPAPPVISGDTPPPSADDNTLWWDSAGLTLYYRYFDGNSSQWVSTAVGLSGQYLPIAAGMLPISLSGAVGDGLTDDRPAIQAWLNALSTSTTGAEIILPPNKWYLINSAPLTIPPNIVIRGAYGTQNNQLASGGVGFFNGGGFLVNPTLSAGIIMQQASQLRSVKVYRTGLVANASTAVATAAYAAWAAEAVYRKTSAQITNGTTVIPIADTSGITVGMPVTGSGPLGPGGRTLTVQSIVVGVSVTVSAPGVIGTVPAGTYLRFGGSIGVQISANNGGILVADCCIVGFRTGIQAYPGQYWIERCHGDCITNIEALNGGDTAAVNDCEYFPHYGNLTNNAARDGASFFIHDGGVTTYWYNCFSYGWRIGWHVYNATGAAFTSCGAEAIALGPASQAGTKNWLIEFGSQVRLYGCHAQAAETGFHLNGTNLYHLYNCDSSGFQPVAGENIAHFYVENTGSANSYGDIISPNASSGYPNKVPIKFGSGTLSGCNVKSPTFFDMALPAGSVTVPFLQGTLPNALGPVLEQGTVYDLSPSGSTYTVPPYFNGLVLGQAATLAAYTVTLPPYPADRQVFVIRCNSAITTLTINTSDGSTVGNYSSPRAGSLLTLLYVAAANKWFCGQGAGGAYLPLTGGTLTGPLTIAGGSNPITITAGAGAGAAVAFTRGGTAAPGYSFDTGISLGSQVGASNADFSKHLSLYGAQYGIGVTGSRLNYISAGSHYFMTNAVDAVSIVNTSNVSSVVMRGTTANIIDFQNVGVGAPTFTTRANGAKVLLYNGLSGSAADIALGVETGFLWSGVRTTADGFKWYAGTTEVMRLTGAGAVTHAGSIGVNGSAAPAKPTVTGSRAGNAALASLLTALASYGLITDSSTA